MSKIKIGPLSTLHFNMIVEKLERAGVPYLRSDDEIALIKYQKLDVEKRTTHPTFSGMAEFIYLEIEKEQAALIKDDLIKFGVSFDQGTANCETENEFVCPKCGKVSNVPGVCVKDGKELITYSVWANRRKKRKEIPLFVICILAVIILAYVVYSSER
jgi:predicted RNA-binding Zn-ribbon protein involved in translation (DUF1610 family)